jgi:predicted DNA-binding transcriptional regulator AlpA
MAKIMNMADTQEYTSLSRATINRHRQIGDFPKAVRITDTRIGFVISEVEDWLASRPREMGPEVNDNKRRVRCPQTPSEMDEARLRECAELKAKKQGDAS